jgi:hypothetical protein
MEVSLHPMNLKNFCETHGIKRQYSTARTPQQNGVVERKNRHVQEIARTMLNEAKLSDSFWREAVYTIVYILNRGKIRVNSDKTPYELWKGRPTSIKHFRIFGSKCYIKRDDEDLGKFDSREDEGIFLGYSSRSKAYRCYNKRLQNIVESINVKIDEARPHKNKLQKEIENEEEEEEENEEEEEENEEEEEETETKIHKPHQGLCRRTIQKT